MKHLWSIICRDLSLDEKTNNISLFNVIEEIGIEKQQMERIRSKIKNKDSFLVPFGFTLVTLLQRDGSNDESVITRIKFTLKDPNSRVMLEHEREIEFIAGKKRLRVLTQIMDIKLSESGEYIFFISLKKDGGSFQEIGSVPIEVKF